MLLISQNKIYIYMLFGTKNWALQQVNDNQINTLLEMYLHVQADSFLVNEKILVTPINTFVVYIHVSFNDFLVSKSYLGLQHFHKISLLLLLFMSIIPKACGPFQNQQ